MIIIQLYSKHITHKLFHHITALCRLCGIFCRPIPVTVICVKLATTLKSATCHGWPYYYGTGTFPWYCTWPLLYTLATCLSQIMAKGTHFLLCFLYIFNHPMLANLRSCIVVVSYCTYTEIPTRQQNYLLSNQPPSFVHKYAQHIGIFWWHMITVLEIPTEWEG
jgi:hypothetical protein